MIPKVQEQDGARVSNILHSDDFLQTLNVILTSIQWPQTETQHHPVDPKYKYFENLFSLVS